MRRSYQGYGRRGGVAQRLQATSLLRYSVDVPKLHICTSSRARLKFPNFRDVPRVRDQILGCLAAECIRSTTSKDRT